MTTRYLELSGWIGLLVAFSPVIAQLATVIVTLPEHRHAALGWLLFVLALRHGNSARAAPRPYGLGLIALGALLEVLGIAGGSWAVARLGLPLAVCGLALRFGRPPLTTAALSLWALPLPGTVASLLKPLSIHRHLADLATGLLTPLGAPLTVVGRAIHTPDGILDVTSRPGWVLVYILAGLGWYSAARSGLSLPGALARAALWAVWAIPLQALAILGAAGVLWLGEAKLARAWLGHGAGLVTAAVGLAIAERRHRSEATRIPGSTP